MHLLSGVGGSCEPTDRVNNVPRRDSSISLEESAYKRDNPDPSRNTLVPLESQKIEDRHEPSSEHGCTLPTPSLPSSPSVVAPMDAYLRCGESLEARLIRLGAILSQDRQTSEPENISLSPEASSWDVVNTPQTLDQKVPSTPLLQPTQGPKTTDLQPTTTDPDIEVIGRISVDSKSVSDLLLSGASQTASDSTEDYKEAVIEYRNAAKRSRRKDRARIHKDLKKRSHKKREAKSGSV
ncbi:uncharacterized protein BKA55DRAFT_686383 [Fusarium redolens]|uniref:Uncharacterized protein n=1 Tax=Fusarium redolens TaxID=48865 RepID=A0A9P9KNI0_FUSRE|nr:uncharacterized protein BKA55DRAFT_686383 [Fusarium redolens]KAH7260804.1 hypothetical protein BKA55DRAFT_686383 [Fusarium redolens]